LLLLSDHRIPAEHTVILHRLESNGSQRLFRLELFPSVLVGLEKATVGLQIVLRGVADKI
jgi:hypothetical protein